MREGPTPQRRLCTSYCVHNKWWMVRCYISIGYPTIDIWDHKKTNRWPTSVSASQQMCTHFRGVLGTPDATAVWDRTAACAVPERTAIAAHAAAASGDPRLGAPTRGYLARACARGGRRAALARTEVPLRRGAGDGPAGAARPCARVHGYLTMHLKPPNEPQKQAAHRVLTALASWYVLMIPITLAFHSVANTTHRIG